MGSPEIKHDLVIKFGSEYGPEEERAVLDVLHQNAPTSGDACIQFEKDFAAYCGTRHARAVSNGTAALFMSMVALGIKPGDRVITTPLTWIATAAAPATLGADVDFVDIDPVTYNLDPGQTKAIIPVHLYGQCCDMDSILAVAKERGIAVVEDACHTVGGSYKGRMAGSMGVTGCFSFHDQKNMTTLGEGGMVVTDDEALAEKARRLKDLAHAPGRRFLHTELAFNYRMTNVQAAIGLAQLEAIDRFITLKRRMAEAYGRRLAKVPGLTLPPEKPWARSVYWMYAVVVEDDFGMPRDALMAKLKERGIDTRTFFIPVHRQPLFAKDPDYTGADCPVADDLGVRGFYLPSGLALKPAQIKTVCDAVREIQSGR